MFKTIFNSEVFCNPVEHTYSLLSCVRLHCYGCSWAKLKSCNDGDGMGTLEKWSCDNKDCRLYMYRFGAEPIRSYWNWNPEDK